MSKLGPIKMGDFTNHPHMRIDGLPPDGISNETEREIDMEVRALIDEAYKNALNCLTEHRDQLDKIAEELLVKETISIAQINELLGVTPASENSSGSVAAEPAVETGEQADA